MQRYEVWLGQGDQATNVRQPALEFAQLGYHLMLEKPLSTTWSSTRQIIREVEQQGRLLAVGHVLRYSPFNMLLKRLVSTENAIGKVVHIQHTERTGWWHFAHSYVRGNWRNQGLDETGKETGLGAPSLLGKCCHDTDLILWLLDGVRPTRSQQSAVECAMKPTFTTPCNASLTNGPIEEPCIAGESINTSNSPLAVYSTGSLALFTKSNRPKDASDHCLTCPIEKSCLYSAKRIYIEHALKNPKRGVGWPASVLVPDLEDYPPERREAAILDSLSPERNSRYGQCVWNIPDNDVCEQQTVTFTFPGGVIASLNMVATAGPASKRLTTLYGTHGELHADAETKKIVVHTFADDTKREYQPPSGGPGGVGDSHGGGDAGLVKAFVEAMWMCERGDSTVQEAQYEHLGTSLAEIEKGYRAVWVAEKSRMLGNVVPWETEL